VCEIAATCAGSNSETPALRIWEGVTPVRANSSASARSNRHRGIGLRGLPLLHGTTRTCLSSTATRSDAARPLTVRSVRPFGGRTRFHRVSKAHFLSPHKGEDSHGLPLKNSISLSRRFAIRGRRSRKTASRNAAKSSMLQACSGVFVLRYWLSNPLQPAQDITRFRKSSERSRGIPRRRASAVGTTWSTVSRSQ